MAPTASALKTPARPVSSETGRKRDAKGNDEMGCPSVSKEKWRGVSVYTLRCGQGVSQLLVRAYRHARTDTYTAAAYSVFHKQKPFQSATSRMERTTACAACHAFTLDREGRPGQERHGRRRFCVASCGREWKSRVLPTSRGRTDAARNIQPVQTGMSI